MITDMIDLEQVLDQYDPGTVILIGPLLRLSISKYRYFFVAGHGSKICESIGIGLIESEDDAHKQYADILQKLEARFARVTTFRTHLEMAQAVHAQWPNEETANFLASAEFAAEAEAPAGPPASSDDSNQGDLAPIEEREQDIAAIASDDSGSEANVAIMDAPPSAPEPGGRDFLQALSLHTSRRIETAEQPSGTGAAVRPEQQGDRIGTTESPSGSSVAARPEHQPVERPFSSDLAAWPEQQQGDQLPLKESSVASAAAQSRFQLRNMAWSPLILGICLGAAGAGVASLVLTSITRQATHEPPMSGSAASLANPTTAQDRLPAPVASQAAQEPLPPPVPSRAAADISPAPSHVGADTAPAPAPSQADADTSPARIPSSPSSALSQVAHDTAVVPKPPTSAQPDNNLASADPATARAITAQPPTSPAGLPNAPPSSAPSPPPLANTGSQTAPHHLDDDAIAMLLDRSKILLDSGDLASARLLLERAAEAGSANAALKLGETFDPKFLQSLGTLGVVPDVAMARQWYEKAAALGSESAAQRIAELTAH